MSKTEIDSKFSKKSILALAAAIGLTVSVGVGGTFAYFTYREQNASKLNVGYNEIAIQEDFNGPDELKAGDNTYQKVIQVENTGNIACYVRVFMDFSEGSVRDVSSFSGDGTNFYSAKSYADHLPDGWIYVSPTTGESLGDYYYYTKALEPGDETTALIKKVNTSFADANAVEEYELIVYSESIQTLDKDGKPFDNTANNGWKLAWNEFLNNNATNNN